MAKDGLAEAQIGRDVVALLGTLEKPYDAFEETS